jgi:transposase
VPSVQVSQFQRGQRYQILPAYAQYGIILSRIFRGPTNASVFEDFFIEQLLQHCGTWPEPKSVLVMDNASFHQTERVKNLCSAAGVKLIYLLPYSPDLNLIEEFFAELKGFIKRHYQDRVGQAFADFLEWRVDVVGAREESAKVHFRHAGHVVEEYRSRASSHSM